MNYDPRDPFREERIDTGLGHMAAEGQEMPLILRLQDVRKACKDWKTFSSDDPYMIVPHCEADVRSVRQLPIERDPQDHTDYRALVEPFFNRPNDPDYQQNLRMLVDDVLTGAAEADSVEVVRQVALPLQSRALAKLLNVDESHADLWISWGTHVFKDGVSKGPEMEAYHRDMFHAMEDSDEDDFFSLLNRAEFRGRKLEIEEKMGFANLAFAGGRDTVIHTVSTIIAPVAQHPEQVEFLHHNPEGVVTATEEFVRYVSPLTAIARRCPHGAAVLDAEVSPGNRVGLCWPSANRDETYFESADEVILDRSPNPHEAFGFGIHKCLGAPQARAIIRCLLASLSEIIESIRLIEAVPQFETESSFKRQVGFERIDVSFVRRRT